MVKWDMDYVIGLALRIGVIISVVLILIGVTLLVIEGKGLGYSDSQIMSVRSRVNTTLLPPSVALTGLSHADGLSFIVLGLMLLILTPVIRVALGIVSFTMEKDWIYVVITIIVFINLMLAIFVIPALLHI
ncbi:DUF1634 domain-containing protein [Caldivirga maquilingensis]|uniref:DUF1634 domain-containing protein n=1 Tax=Caldivirga maquilingensis (strain ATCC 700844 / DSM 13496 / JCM 10307 / IC-167) TaxID=397948 RepID=A8MDC0_CALMQ|nr:DUF1634 domain-containing protein [Caldivirga maquilingensis]ABW01776.1 protein of unknown function DUF1634 [Caldivirga maquilingensis IC-167]